MSSSSFNEFPDDMSFPSFDQSQRYDSFPNFNDSGSVIDDSSSSVPIYTNNNNSGSFGMDTSMETPIYVSSGGFESELGFENSGLNGSGGVGDDLFVNGNGPVLPDMEEMGVEVGAALREWRRQNAIRLEEKEKKEKDLLNQIIEEAEDYKIEFYRRRKLHMENKKSENREKEKTFVANEEKIHLEADKNYWKTITDLVPHEVAALEKRGKKDKKKKPSIVVIQGPKPGKPTDLSRMRQILVKLKANPPTHMKTAPPPPPPAPAAAQSKDPKTASVATDITKAVPVLQPVAVA